MNTTADIRGPVSELTEAGASFEDRERVAMADLFSGAPAGPSEPFRYVSELMKVMEAAWTGDTKKAAAYVRLIADKMERDGSANQAQYLRRRIDELEGTRRATVIRPASAQETGRDDER